MKTSQTYCIEIEDNLILKALITINYNISITINLITIINWRNQKLFILKI